MTNNNQMLMIGGTGRERTVRTWIDYQQALVQGRLDERRAEAAAERLAASGSRQTSSLGLRTSVGRSLIRLGRAIAPEVAAPVPARQRRIRI